MSIVITAGMKLTPARLNALAPRYARKTANEIVNNSSALQDDNHLFLTVEASAVYEMNLRLRYSTGAIPTIKWGWTFPAGLTITGHALRIASGATVWSVTEWSQTTVLDADDTGATVDITGQVVVSTSAGTLQLQWAQLTSNASDTTVLAGSWLMLRRME